MIKAVFFDFYWTLCVWGLPLPDSLQNIADRYKFEIDWDRFDEVVVHLFADASDTDPSNHSLLGSLLYGFSVFGSLVHDTSLFEQIPEELMQESPFFQRQREKFVAQGITQGAKEATLKNLLTVLNAKFHLESVRTLVPALENIDDLERLEQLHLTAVNAENFETFIEDLFE